MKTKKNDLVEVDYTARIKDGPIFDTTSEEEAKKAGLVDENFKREFRPVKILIGKGEVIKGFDKALENKEIGREYEQEISSKDAFGPRDARLIRTVPLHAFEKQPVRGMFVNVNNFVAKVISVTGGRVLVDLNNPLAGKDLVYKFKILRVVEDDKEKISFLAKKFGLKVEINEKEEEIKARVNCSDETLKKIEKDCEGFIKKKIIFEKISKIEDKKGEKKVEEKQNKNEKSRSEQKE
ncbi:MAG: peptidylprolyl isomerase [Candidatus Pacearchaeota archaeon]